MLTDELQHWNMDKRASTMLDESMERPKEEPLVPIPVKRRVVETIAACLFASVCLVVSVENGKFCYVSSHNSNETYEVAAPFLFSTMTNTCYIFAYPLVITVLHLLQKLEFDTSELSTHALILGHEEYEKVVNCILLVTIWKAITYCYYRALKDVTGVDILTHFLFYPVIAYSLDWVILMKKFIGLRVIALTLASSGVVIYCYRIYANFWDNVVAVTSVTGFAVFSILIRKSVFSPSNLQILFLFFVIGCANTVLFWPIAIILSVATATEPCNWTLFPASRLFFTAICLVGFTSMFLAHNIRIYRSILRFSLLMAICFAIPVEVFYLHTFETMNPWKCVGFSLLIVAFLLRMLPDMWHRKILHFLRDKKAKLAKIPRRSLLPSRSKSSSTLNDFQIH